MAWTTKLTKPSKIGKIIVTKSIPIIKYFIYKSPIFFFRHGKKRFSRKKPKRIYKQKKQKDKVFFAKKQLDSPKMPPKSDKNAKNGEETQKKQPSCQGAQTQVTIILLLKRLKSANWAKKSHYFDLRRSTDAAKSCPMSGGKSKLLNSRGSSQ